MSSRPKRDRVPHPLFDPEYYLQQNPDVAGSEQDPFAHFLRFGAAERRRAHPLFDPIYYMRQNPDVAAAGKVAMFHYLATGGFEGRKPHTLFDSRFYLDSNPDVANAGVNPLVHFIEAGAAEGRSPHPLFDSAYYLELYPEVAEAGINPLIHFLLQDAGERRRPHPLFDTGYYLDRNPDVAKAGKNALVHFLEAGAAEGRSPNSKFDTRYYLKQNPDVAEKGVNPLIHFIEYGAREGRKPHPDFDTKYYLEKHPDVSQSGINPLIHFFIHDDHESRATKPAALTLGSVDWSEPDNDLSNDAYVATKSRIQSAREQKRRYEPTRPSNLIEISPNDIVGSAARLSFPIPESPTVSVIIPVYNNVRFTLECLTSMMRYPIGLPHEIIIIDDGSTDATESLMKAMEGVVYIKNENNLGFLLSCNKAAARARGQFLLFLNNDAQVTEGWFAPLWNALQDSSVGIVSPKLLFPNGALQEAGARILRDCRSELIGVFENPEQPRFNYSRPVDYVSGACMLMRGELFKSLDGFDTFYAPAYCEDVDICFRAREAGFKVLYVPQSTVIHHLSITSNAVDPGYKLRRVTVNQQKLAERWQSRFDELNDVRIVAFYLPQFHPIPENSIWWGAGFTEWTNVTKARPNFNGHYQPHLPADVGFYDLRVPEVMDQQAELASRYGIYGFCHFYYWFNGKRMLELPLERMLATGKPVFPFCLSWANENWTKRWDGREHEVLLGQHHSDDDDRAVIRDLMRYMRDPRYIQINGRPLLLIYRISLFPNIQRSVEIWRETCRREGLGDIYLAFVESFNHATAFEDPKRYGFDASVEYPPHGTSARIDLPGPLINREFQGVVNDYQRLIETYTDRPISGYTRFRGVMPSWDNTPRRQDHATIFHDASPGAYQAWLETVMEDTRRQNFGEERIVFVNAWNEWAEGAHLEPDRRFGHRYLEATKNARDAWMLR